MAGSSKEEVAAADASFGDAEAADDVYSASSGEYKSINIH
jgi:hypothetical protein